MKTILKRIIRKILDPVVYRMGYNRPGMHMDNNLIHLDNNEKNNLLHSFYHLLKIIPFHPGHIIVLWLAELVFVKRDGIIDSYKWV